MPYLVKPTIQTAGFEEAYADKHSDAEYDALKSEKEKVDKENTQLKTDKQKLESEKEQLQQEKSTLESTNKTQAARITKLEAKITELGGDPSEVQ